jgi:hypothetical protein
MMYKVSLRKDKDRKPWEDSHFGILASKDSGDLYYVGSIFGESKRIKRGDRITDAPDKYKIVRYSAYIRQDGVTYKYHVSRLRGGPARTPEACKRLIKAWALRVLQDIKWSGQ